MCSPSGPLKFIAIDVLGVLPQTKFGNQFVIILTARYSKLTRRIPTTDMSSAPVAHKFLSNCIIPYGMPNIIISDNGQYFVSELLIYIHQYLGEKKSRQQRTVRK